MEWIRKRQVPKNEGIEFAAQIFTWMETYLYIRTKKMQIVPYRMNSVQQILMQEVARCWFHGVPVRIVQPKARQMGCSTAWQLLLLSMCELMEGFRVGVVAHDEEGSREVFSRVKTCIRQLARTSWPKPNLLHDQGAYYHWESESAMGAATIKTGDALGKGGTPSAVHFSESAKFSDKGINAKKAVNSIINARADTRWAIDVHESTAKGKDPFFYPLCEKSRDPDSGSTFRLIFLPWFLEKGYRMSWADYRKELLLASKADPGPRFHATSEELALKERLATQVVEDHERNFRYKVKLSNQQLIWRRWALANKCEGDEDEFKRYYPSFYEECFTASASCYFEPKVIDHYRRYSRPEQVRGNIEMLPSGPVFERDRHGPVQVWDFPRLNEAYSLAGDPGGEKIKADPHHAYVVNKDSLEVVAAVHGKFEWDQFADICYALGMWYNKAILLMENNKESAIAKRLHRKNYPRLYYYYDQDQIKAKEGRTPGFNTNKKTRSPMLRALRRACRQHAFMNPDPEFWKEMEDFVWCPRPHAVNPDTDGEYRATGSNHDDRILTAAIALTQCVVPEAHALNWNKPPDQPSRAYKMFLRLQKEAETEARAGAGEYLHLGVNRAP